MRVVRCGGFRGLEQPHISMQSSMLIPLVVEQINPKDCCDSPPTVSPSPAVWRVSSALVDMVRDVRFLVRVPG